MLALPTDDLESQILSIDLFRRFAENPPTITYIGPGYNTRQRPLSVTYTDKGKTLWKMVNPGEKMPLNITDISEVDPNSTAAIQIPKWYMEGISARNAEEDADRIRREMLENP